VVAGGNVLIVEDEDDWAELYEDAARAVGLGGTTRTAKDRASAERLISKTRFAVAFVDVSLDSVDGRNTDGLRVMKKIRAVGDKTSIIVVTGRGGQDAIKIARDALKEYDAFETLGKSAVKASELGELLKRALDEYRKVTPVRREEARDALRGEVSPPHWDDQVMRATRFRGDAGSFYDFLTKLYGDFLPLVARGDGGQADIDPETGLVFGDYWSRGIAGAVLICFGPAEPLDRAIAAGRDGAAMFGRYQVGRVLTEATHRKGAGDEAVKGAVFLLEGCKREDFGET
jgi:ActR/RegA family two-component response regulator